MKIMQRTLLPWLSSPYAPYRFGRSNLDGVLWAQIVGTGHSENITWNAYTLLSPYGRFENQDIKDVQSYFDRKLEAEGFLLLRKMPKTREDAIAIAKRFWNLK